jgi:hypothetical protein
VTGGRIGVGSGVGVTAGAEVGTTGAGVGVVGWGVASLWLAVLEA